VAFSPTLESGDTSNIFKGPDGYYIVKVTDIKAATAKPYSDVKEDLKKGVLEEKQNEVYKGLTDKLQGETKIEIYEGKVD
jgi:parvulin-like peptidyl-prolyl isomerase